MPKILKNVYLNLHHVDGEDYKSQSIKCIRAGINQWTKANRNVDIIADVRSSKANEIFKGVSKITRENGKGTTKSTPAIAQEDTERIAYYFLHDIMNKPDPRKLEMCIILHNLFLLLKRERQPV